MRNLMYNLTVAEENLELYMKVSEDIARMVQRHRVKWNVQGRQLNLNDFKFNVDYPNPDTLKEFAETIRASPKDWETEPDDSRSTQIYEDTKKAIQTELGIYSEKRTIDELEEELLQIKSSESGAYTDKLDELLQPVPSELGTYSGTPGELEADLLLEVKAASTWLRIMGFSLSIGGG